MGLLDKVRKLESLKKPPELPRYFLFKFVFESLLKDIGAREGAFLVKQGKFFHLAFPINVDCDVFRKYSLDASLISSSSEKGEGAFLLLEKETDSISEMELLSTSLLYKMDELGCIFLLMDFADRANVIEKNNDVLLAKVKEFKKVYEQNKILVDTSIPLFPKYLGISAIESKMQGAVLASTTPNFLEFNFSSMFNFPFLHQDRDNLPLFYSIVNRITKMIGRSNFTILEKNLTLNACIFASIPLDYITYSSTLKTVLFSIYGCELIDKLEISFVKTLSDKKERIASWIADSYDPYSYEC